MSISNSQPFPVADIIVDRATRQRQNADDFDVSDLLTSLQAIGLLNPLIIERSGVLRAGERRLTAVKQLGWTHVDVRFVEDLDEIELHLLELDENLRRKNLNWQDQCRAISEYHRLQGARTTGWSAEQTADALGMTSAWVSQHLLITREIEAGNEKVINADRFSQARTITEKVNSRRRAEAITKALAETSGQSVAQFKEERATPLLNVDFNEWAPLYRGEPFNFIHCDFPYGVNMTGSGQGANKVMGEYADEEDVYWKLLTTLHENADRLIAKSAHIMFWFSMDFYYETKSALEGMGFVVNPFPLIWYKSDNTGMMPDVKRQGRRVYETALFGSRDDRLIIDAVSNLFPYPGREKEIHMSEKPIPMLKHFMRMFVDEYSLVLDPTCGSANALRAASQLNAKSVLGLERDTEFFTLAKEHFFDDDSITL